MRRFLSVLLVALGLAAGPAFAGNQLQIMPSASVPATPGGDNDTSLFAGLTWTFGSGGPGLGGAFGVVYSEVDAGGDVSGGILSLNFDLQGRGTPVDFRVVGFAGNDDVAGQLGVGFTLDGSDVFGILGFLTNHTQGGLTFGFDGDVGGFLGIHSHEFLEPRMTLQAPVMNDPQQIMLTRPGGV
jgi:hypothetical protein